MERKDEPIKFDDICYFFDGERREALDHGLITRRMVQFVGLRDRILSLPEEQFDVLMRTILAMVNSPNSTTEQPENQVSRQNALELFKSTQSS